jgi:hypothetical protein
MKGKAQEIEVRVNYVLWLKPQVPEIKLQFQVVLLDK